MSPGRLRAPTVLLGAAVMLLGAAAHRRAAAQEATTQVGLASYYAHSLQRQRTASGAHFDNRALVAAHPTLPIGTIARVTNVGNGRSVEVRIVDRGPAASRQRDGFIVDLSRAAARRLDMLRDGRATVRVDVVRAAAATP